MTKIGVVGIGNPGEKYAKNRHNIGFQILDTFAAKHELHFNERKLVSAHVAPYDETILLAKPDVFVNESGITARALVRNYDMNIVVVYDDITINIGETKCSFGRGDGGHNGLTSIIEQLGTKDFFRIRVGIRPVHEELLPKILPPNGFETFMLSDFAPFEKELRDKAITKAVDIIEALPHKSFEEIMNQYN